MWVPTCMNCALLLAGDFAGFSSLLTWLLSCVSWYRFPNPAGVGGCGAPSASSASAGTRRTELPSPPALWCRSEDPEENMYMHIKENIKKHVQPSHEPAGTVCAHYWHAAELSKIISKGQTEIDFQIAAEVFFYCSSGAWGWNRCPSSNAPILNAGKHSLRKHFMQTHDDIFHLQEGHIQKA